MTRNNVRSISTPHSNKMRSLNKGNIHEVIPTVFYSVNNDQIANMEKFDFMQTQSMRSSKKVPAEYYF